MTYNHDTGESYSNDNHPEFPYGMKFTIKDTFYGIYRTDDISNMITVISKRGGHQYIKLDKLRELFESGEAIKVEEDVSNG